MINILIYHNSEQIKTYQFELDSITLGRLPTNNMPINSMAISRNHLRFDKTNTGYQVTDLNSLNGTYIAGNKITTAELKSGTQIAIGQYSIVPEFFQAPLAVQEPFKEAEHVNKSNIYNPEIPEGEEHISLVTPDSTELIFTDKDIIAEEEPVEEIEDIKESKAVLIETNKKIIYKITRKKMTFGSDRKNDIYIEGGMFDGDMVVTLIFEDDIYTLLSNKKGKFKVNGKKESEYILSHKDKIEMGNSTFSFMIKDE